MFIHSGHYNVWVVTIECNWCHSEGWHEHKSSCALPKALPKYFLWNLQIRVYVRFSWTNQIKMPFEFIFGLFLTFSTLLTISERLLSRFCTSSYCIFSALLLFSLPVILDRYTDLGMIASCPELSTSRHSSCFHTTILFSWALERSHAASLIKVPHALLELKLLCSIINHKKAECVLWLFRNKLRPNEEKKSN